MAFVRKLAIAYYQTTHIHGQKTIATNKERSAENEDAGSKNKERIETFITQPHLAHQEDDEFAKQKTHGQSRYYLPYDRQPDVPPSEARLRVYKANESGRKDIRHRVVRARFELEYRF